MEPLVFPQINVKDYPSESLDYAFDRYNRHDHGRVSPADFRLHDVSVGDAVYLYSDEGARVLAGIGAATVEFLTGSKLRLSRTCTQTVENVTLYCKADRSSQQGAVLVRGVNMVEGSNFCTFYQPLELQPIQRLDGDGLPGSLSPHQFSTVLYSSAEANYTDIETFPDSLLPIDLSLRIKSRLYGFSLLTYGFNATARLFIYRSSNLNHVFSNHLTWDPYGAAFPIDVNSGLIHRTLIPKKGTITGTYPLDRPGGVLEPGVTVGLGLSNITDIDPQFKSRVFCKLHYCRIASGVPVLPPNLNPPDGSTAGFIEDYAVGFNSQYLEF